MYILCLCFIISIDFFRLEKEIERAEKENQAHQKEVVDVQNNYGFL